jgi:thiamine biosynthesis lipoprotein
VRALRGAVDAVIGSPEETEASKGPPERTALEVAQERDALLTVSRRAMACTFEVYLPAVLRGVGTEAALAALDLVDELESQMTVYRETSEVLEVNRLAAFRPVEVEARMFGLLERALEISHATDGAFDLTTGPLSDVWGFSRRQGRLPSPEELEFAMSRVGYEHVVLDHLSRSISFSKEGVAINLNGIGKGYALDRVAELLAGAGLDHFLLHGGNSSVLARTADGDNPPWRIGVRNPVRPTERVGEVLIGSRAVGTSGSGTQNFHHSGKRYGHILDPRTGWPADGVLSATVLAPTGADADALATAFYVMGPDAAEEFCRHRPEIRALLICPPRSGARVNVHLMGESDGWWRPL